MKILVGQRSTRSCCTETSKRTILHKRPAEVALVFPVPEPDGAARSPPPEAAGARGAAASAPRGHSRQ